MADIEKVIKGLESCKHPFCQTVDCPYAPWDRDLTCKDELFDDAIELLKTQEPKTGYWIESAGDDKCSVCGATYSDLYPDYQHTHYCPNCGAKMEGR